MGFPLFVLAFPEIANAKFIPEGLFRIPDTSPLYMGKQCFLYRLYKQLAGLFLFVGVKMRNKASVVTIYSFDCTKSIQMTSYGHVDLCSRCGQKGWWAESEFPIKSAGPTLGPERGTHLTKRRVCWGEQAPARRCGVRTNCSTKRYLI